MTKQQTKKRSSPGNVVHDPSSGMRAFVEPKVWHCVGVMTGIVFLLFHEILLGNAWLWEDMLYYSYPVRSFASTSMASGQMPLWNPYTFNGMPFLADIQTAVFYLPLTVLVLFVKDGHLSFYWLQLVVILHFLLAGTAMFFLAQSFGLRRIPSLFGGIAYMLSGFMIVHTIHQQIITLVAWYPLVFMLFRKSLHGEAWVPVFLCSLVLGLSTLAGYPQLSLYLYFFLFLYFLFELLTTHRGGNLLSKPALKMSTKAAVVVILSLTVAMIQLLPTVELADLSQRAQITYEKSTEGSLAWSQLLTLCYPRFFGSAGANGYNYWGPGTYWYYWETCIYLGVLPLLLTLMSIPLLKQSRHVAFLIGMAAFVMLFALGDNFFLQKLFFDFVPGFSKFRNPARMGIWFVFATSLLSSFSLQALMVGSLSERERTLRKRILLGAGTLSAFIGILVLTGSLTDSFPFLANGEAFQTVKRESMISILILVVSGSALFMMLTQGNWRLVVGVALVLVFVLDMLHFGASQNTAKVNPSEYFQRATNIIQFLKKQGESDVFRVNTRNSRGMIMDRNQGMVDRIAIMEGYTPLVLQRAYAPYGTADQTYDLLNVKYKTVANEQTGTLTLVNHPSYFPRAFFLYGIHVAKNEEELLAFLRNPAFNHRTTAVLEKEPGRSFAVPSTTPVWKANITGYQNNSITLDAETTHDGLLVLSEIEYPGWKAFVDGTEAEILRADYNLRSIVVTSGVHKIEFRFEPASYKLGGMITLASLLICGAGIGIPFLKKKRVINTNEPA